MTSSVGVGRTFIEFTKEGVVTVFFRGIELCMYNTSMNGLTSQGHTGMIALTSVVYFRTVKIYAAASLDFKFHPNSTPIPPQMDFKFEVGIHLN